MKGEQFDFRMDRLLALRERHEEEAGLAVAAARARVETLRDVLREVEGIVQQARLRVLGQSVRGSQPGDRFALGMLLEQAEARAAEIRTQIIEAEANERSCLEALAARTQERRVLERLREKHRAAWRADAEQRARVAMDAIALRHATAGPQRGIA